MKLLMFLFFILLFSFGCRNKISHESKILSQVENIFIIDPDSALELLSGITDADNLSDKDKADYWRLKGMSEYFGYREIVKEPMIMYSIEYYKKHKMTKQLIDSYLLLAAQYNENHEYLPAMDNLLTGLSLAVQINDSLQIATIHKRLGYIYMDNNLEDKAIESFRKSLQYEKNNHSALYYLGLIEVTDSAEYYRIESIKMAIEMNDIITAKRYITNYTYQCMLHKNYNKAKEYLELLDTYGIDYSYPDRFDILWGEIYLSTGYTDSAEYYLKKAEQEMPDVPDTEKKHIDIFYYNGTYCLRSFIDYLKHEKVNISAFPEYNFLMSSLKMKDILIEEERNKTLLLELENSNWKLENQKIQLQFKFFILILVFFIIIVLLYLRMLFVRKRVRLAEADERYEALIRMINNISENKPEVPDQNVLLKIIFQQLGFIRKIANSPTPENHELLKRIVNFSDNDESLLEWEDIYSIINMKHNSFHRYLVNSYGYTLIDKEIQLCCLLCEGFTTKDISVLIRQSSQTIYQRKTTIRKKLGMGEKEDIIVFLKNRFNDGNL